MKGRRKAKTDKWKMKQQFIEEARSFFMRRAARAEGVESPFRSTPTLAEEPIGILAGTRAVRP